MKTIKLFYTKLSLFSCFRFQKIFAGAITKINNEMPSVSAKQHLVNSPFYFVSGKALLYPSIMWKLVAQLSSAGFEVTPKSRTRFDFELAGGTSFCVGADSTKTTQMVSKNTVNK